MKNSRPYFRLSTFCFLLAFALASATGFGQQDPQYSQYMFNPLIINPAYAGSREGVSAVLLHRSQWLGFDGAPTTQSFSIHAPVTKKNIGLGLSVIHDKLGPTNSFQIAGNYAYRFRLGKGKLAFGLRTALFNYVFDWNMIDYKDPGEMPKDKSSNWIASVDFGMRFNTRTFYGGFAFSHHNQPSFFQNITDTAVVGYNSYLAPHFVFTMGKAFEITDVFVLKPSILFKASEGNEAMADLNLSFVYDKTLAAGFSIRPSYGIIFMIEYNITDKLRAGYSFDLGLTKLTTHHAGSHEIFIGFDISRFKNKVLSPRYF